MAQVRTHPNHEVQSTCIFAYIHESLLTVQGVDRALGTWFLAGPSFRIAI
jgi:hypothetical protein